MCFSNLHCKNNLRDRCLKTTQNQCIEFSVFIHAHASIRYMRRNESPPENNLLKAFCHITFVDPPLEQSSGYLITIIMEALEPGGLVD